MKTAILTSILAVLAISGCKSEKLIVIDTKSQTNTIQKTSSRFSDETYVWESWIFSTNQVKETTK